MKICWDNLENLYLTKSGILRNRLICRSCNSSANFNKEWHVSFYNEIIRRIYENIEGK